MPRGRPPVRRRSVRDAQARVERDLAEKRSPGIPQAEMRLRMMERLARTRRLHVSDVADFFAGGRLGDIGAAVLKWSREQAHHTAGPPRLG